MSCSSRPRQPLDEGPGQRCLVPRGETAPWWGPRTEISLSSGRDGPLMRGRDRDVSFLGARQPLDEGPGQGCLVPQGKRAPWWGAGTEMSRSSGRVSSLMRAQDRDISFLGARQPLVEGPGQRCLVPWCESPCIQAAVSPWPKRVSGLTHN